MNIFPGRSYHTGCRLSQYIPQPWTKIGARPSSRSQPARRGLMRTLDRLAAGRRYRAIRSEFRARPAPR
jgi:hypothetical protein